MIACPACHAENVATHAFCLSCGAALSSRDTCGSCGERLAAGARFCTTCGTPVVGRPEAPEGPGYVVDGEWHRPPGEFVRRVPLRQMRRAFDSLLPGPDSALGKVVDKLASRSIRVPEGSVGVVLVDGVVGRILPPGRQTTVGWLEELAQALDGDLKGAAASALDRLLQSDRCSFYLVDRRPIPVAFATEVAHGDGQVQTVHVMALVSVGSSKDELGVFLNQALGERDAMAAADLHGRLRSETERAARDALAATPTDWAAAERAVRRTLETRQGTRLGLRFEVLIAPRHTVHRLEIRLGRTPAPTAVPCVECGQELLFGQRFCTRCGVEQPRAAAPDDPRAERAASSAGDVGESGRLVTSDGDEVELDVVCSVQGEGPAKVPTDVFFGAARRHLRDRPYAAVATTAGLAGLEEALAASATDALRALGFRLLGVDVIDLRGKSGEWETRARADMARVRREALVGREWLEVEGTRADLRELSLGVVLRQQTIERDHAFALRKAAIDDARRQAGLEAEARDLAREERAAVHTDDLLAVDWGHERAARQQRHEQERSRSRAGLDSELRRQQVEDEAYARRKQDEVQLERLRAMAVLERELAEREHQQRIDVLARLEGKTEAQMLAMQAAELAGATHGAAFAEALAKLADGEAARSERERADARVAAKDEQLLRLMEKALERAGAADDAARDAHRDSAEQARSVAEASIHAHARVAAAAAGEKPCGSCGASLPAGARFCGGCGARFP